MSKIILEETLKSLNTTNDYNWSLYFFSMDKRSKKNPFKASKIKFKDQNYLLKYGKNLSGTVLKFQVEKTENV